MSMAKALGLTNEQFLSLIEDNCHLEICRYNKNSKCTDEDNRKVCVAVSRLVLCLDERENRKMNLHEFIETYIARNTLVRLWKCENPQKPYGNHIMLTNDAVMEWQILDIERLKCIPVVFITDILCEKDKEAVNIVVETDYNRDDIRDMFVEYEEKRSRHRSYMSDSE